MLEEQRQQIDQIDQQISQLFEQRLTVAKEIATIKHANQLALSNQQREQAILAERSQQVKDPLLAPYLREFYQDIFLISKQYQAKVIKALRD